MRTEPAVLSVGNFDSNIGYAWKLMERLWCELSIFYRARDFKVYVVFPSVTEIPKSLVEHGCIVKKEDFTSRSISSVFRQAKFLRENTIKTIYFTDQETYSFRYLVFRISGVQKIIVHDHTPGVRTRPGIVKRIVKVVLNRLPLISCSACFAVSPYVGKRLIEVNCVPSQKVFCVTNGIDQRQLRSSSTSKDDLIKIVTVGRASYYKGIDFALQVVRSLVFDHGCQNIRYILLGDGPDLTAFKAQAAALKIEPYVRFDGVVNDVAERLEAFDIAFHPSKGEAMSLAILEYMRAGLPVVASDNPSVSSTLKPGYDSVIYDENDANSATTCLLRLISSSELRQRLGSTGQSRVVEEFSTSAMLKRFQNALISVARF